nr:H-NS family nucleoid-associated regulatory protein [uncultured Albidiferax sp.]
MLVLHPQTKGKRAGAAGSVAKAAAKKKTERVIKYKDEAGNSWTGHGKRPGWFKAALEGGKTAADLLVKP